MSMRMRGVVIGLAIVALATVLFWLSRSPATKPGPQPARSPAPAAPRPLATPERPVASPSAPEAEAPLPADTPEDPDFESALRWSLVDLEAVREALPDNLYWEMSVPTDDPEVLAWRREERDRWNREYGKVLSGNATEQEISDYFALRRRISEDAVEFSAYLSAKFGEVLPERDLGLLALASRLHRARLEEMPRRISEALDQKHEQDRLREAWLADEAAFGAAQPRSALDDARD